MNNDSLISMGVVGWLRAAVPAGGVVEPHFDNGTKDNDGNTLYRVQLFAGADSDLLTPEQQSDGQARGYKIICQMSSHIRRIPPVGTKVLVAFPNGYRESAGSGVIIATLEPNPTAADDRAVNVTEDRVSIDYGPDKDIVISGRSVTIRSYDNDFVSVGGSQGPGVDGVSIQSKAGCGAIFQTGKVALFTADNGTGQCMIAIDANSVNILTESAMIQLNSAGFYALGNKCTITGGHVYLGTAPVLATAAAYRPSGPGTVVVGGSTSVFVSP